MQRCAEAICRLELELGLQRRGRVWSQESSQFGTGDTSLAGKRNAIALDRSQCEGEWGGRTEMRGPNGLEALQEQVECCDDFVTTTRKVDDLALEVRAIFLCPATMAAVGLEQGPALTDFKVIVNRPQTDRRVLSLSARRIPGDAERNELILLAIEDITERRRRTDALREGNQCKDGRTLARGVRYEVAAEQSALRSPERCADHRRWPKLLRSLTSSMLCSVCRCRPGARAWR